MVPGQDQGEAGHKQVRQIPPPPPEGTSESLAEEESQAFAQGDYLDRERKRREHNRRESLRDHLAKGFVYLVWLAVGLVAVGSAIWLYHVVMPPGWCWLTETQYAKLESILQTVMFGALIGAVFSEYTQRHL